MYESQSSHAPLTTDWWEWDQLLDGKAAVKLSECDTLHFDTTRVHILGELQLESTTSFLDLIQTTQSRQGGPVHSATPRRQHSSSTPLASSLTATPKVYDRPTTSTKPNIHQKAITEQEIKRRQLDAEVRKLQSSKSDDQGVKIQKAGPDVTKTRDGSALLSSSPTEPSSSPLARFASTSMPPLPQAEERPSKRQKTAQATAPDIDRRAPPQSTSTGRRVDRLASRKPVPTAPQVRSARQTARKKDYKNIKKGRQGLDNNNRNNNNNREDSSTKNTNNHVND